MKYSKHISMVAIALLSVAAVLVYQRNTLARRGERAFTRLGCGGCHFSGAGPNLGHAATKMDQSQLARFIANTPEVYRERGLRPLNEGYMLMPDMHASREDARAIAAYLQDLSKQ